MSEVQIVGLDLKKLEVSMCLFSKRHRLRQRGRQCLLVKDRLLTKREAEDICVEEKDHVSDMLLRTV